ARDPGAAGVADGPRRRRYRRALARGGAAGRAPRAGGDRGDDHGARRAAGRGSARAGRGDRRPGRHRLTRASHRGSHPRGGLPRAHVGGGVMIRLVRAELVKLSTTRLLLWVGLLIVALSGFVT